MQGRCQIGYWHTVFLEVGMWGYDQYWYVHVNEISIVLWTVTETKRHSWRAALVGLLVFITSLEVGLSLLKSFLLPNNKNRKKYYVAMLFRGTMFLYLKKCSLYPLFFFNIMIADLLRVREKNCYYFLLFFNIGKYAVLCCHPTQFIQFFFFFEFR